MKKTFRLIIAATAAITALASCAKDIATEEILNPQEAEGQRVITIAYDAETKTSQDYDWHKVHFVEGDQIKVMDNSGTETCTIHINDGVASFSTSLTGDLTAVYPKECGYKSGRAQTITVATYPPHFQDGTLASGHIVSAQIPAGSTKAVFHNETALLRIIPPLLAPSNLQSLRPVNISVTGRLWMVAIVMKPRSQLWSVTERRNSAPAMCPYIREPRSAACHLMQA